MGKKDMAAEGKIVWVGGYPAHYTRIFHYGLEARFPRKLEFIYYFTLPSS